MATMITNHLMLPLVGWFKLLDFLKRYLLQCRWIAVAAYIMIGYLFERNIGESFMLVNMGIISFAAALQLAPSMSAASSGKRGTSRCSLRTGRRFFPLVLYTDDTGISKERQSARCPS